ncbi:hypothetical protein ABT354_30140 [Streptomyces sp. NPDC000594]|uniref:hypothetical protein n=1 Tax=Streptomyces sp. NPDC000594 TaxID=3154261 RepID=UPI00332C40B6
MGYDSTPAPAEEPRRPDHPTGAMESARDQGNTARDRGSTDRGGTATGSGTDTRERRPGRSGRRRRRRGPTGSRPRGRTATRTLLRRESAGTVAVLADPHDFQAMRRYRTFAFDDHPHYLQETESLLKTLATRQLHTAVALFDPEDFAAYCTEHGLEPDSPLSRARYTAEIPARGCALPYAGEPLDGLLPLLVDTAVRRATWEYASLLLADAGPCADCGQDIGEAALDQAAHLLRGLLRAAGPGAQHLVCSVSAPAEQLIAVFHADGAGTPGAEGAGPADPPGDDDAVPDTPEAAEFITVLATAIALRRPGGLVLRVSTPGAPDRLHGWRIHPRGLDPLSEAEVFSAYCTDAATGEPIAPEPGVEYRAGFPVPDDYPHTDHH